MLLASGLALSLAQVVLWRTGTLGLALGLFMVFGLTSSLFANAASATVQLAAEPHLRGRLMSVYALVELGTLPVGNAFAGAVTDGLGVAMGFLVCGDVTAVGLLATRGHRDGRTHPRHGGGRCPGGGATGHHSVRFAGHWQRPAGFGRGPHGH